MDYFKDINNVPVANSDLAINILTWEEARPYIKKANTHLADIIDELSPGKRYRLYKACYQWGDAILEKGQLNLPRKTGGVVHLSDPGVPREFERCLSYTHAMPMGVVLNNSLELFIELDGQQVASFQTMKKGKIFALWTALDVQSSAHLGKVWTISAGARTFFLASKISDKIHFKRLQRELGLRARAPNSFIEQYAVFREMMTNQSLSPPWTVEVIYFGKEWLEETKAIKWRLFRDALKDIVQRETAYLRNQVVFDYAFSCVLRTQNLKQNPYLVATLQHLYQLVLGGYTGFRFAVNNESGPVNTLSTLFMDIYGLRYAPTFVYQDYLSVLVDKPNEPIYYSLAHPTLLDFYPRSRMLVSKLNDMQLLVYMLNKTQKAFVADELGLKTTDMYKKIRCASFQGFHSGQSVEDEQILNTQGLLERDECLQVLMGQHDKPFNEASPLLKGIVRISSYEE